MRIHTLLLCGFVLSCGLSLTACNKATKQNSDPAAKASSGTKTSLADPIQDCINVGNASTTSLGNMPVCAPPAPMADFCATRDYYQCILNSVKTWYNNKAAVNQRCQACVNAADPGNVENEVVLCAGTGLQPGDAAAAGLINSAEGGIQSAKDGCEFIQPPQQTSMPTVNACQATQDQCRSSETFGHVDLMYSCAPFSNVVAKTEVSIGTTTVEPRGDETRYVFTCSIKYICAWGQIPSANCIMESLTPNCITCPPLVLQAAGSPTNAIRIFTSPANSPAPTNQQLQESCLSTAPTPSGEACAAELATHLAANKPRQQTKSCFFCTKMPTPFPSPTASVVPTPSITPFPSPIASVIPTPSITPFPTPTTYATPTSFPTPPPVMPPM